MMRKQNHRSTSEVSPFVTDPVHPSPEERNASLAWPTLSDATVRENTAATVVTVSVANGEAREDLQRTICSAHTAVPRAQGSSLA